jgi:hypothetical protein
MGSGEDYITRSLSSVLLTKSYSGDQIKKKAMDEACDTYGGRGFWWGHLMERNHFKDLVVDGRVMLK